MSDQLPAEPSSPTIDRLNAIKRTTEKGVEYWRARDLFPVLGYERWSGFEPVIVRATAALAHVGEDPSNHISRTTKMVSVGSGAQRPTIDYYLTRGACYLIAMNATGRNAEVASAQAYFAVQARRAELAGKDLDRLKDRERVTEAFKLVNAAAKDKGVTNYGMFNAAGWKSFYGMSAKEVAALKGVPEGESIMDHAGKLELLGNAFRMELAERRLIQSDLSGEAHAISVNREIGARVRQTMEREIGHGPEALPLEREPIKVVKARLLGKPEPKKITNRR